MRESRKKQKERLLAELQEGDVRTGQVISLCDFGAFVDLGGADGLIHLSELSWRRVTHPGDVLSVGDEVQVYVLKVDRERKRIGLSLKRLDSDPWHTIADRYRVDQLVEGTITKLVKFGAFARIFDDDIEGLIHLSELSEERIAHPKEVVQEGDTRTLRIIRIDSDQRRIGLSLRRVDSAEYADADWGEAYDQAQEDTGEDGGEDEGVAETAGDSESAPVAAAEDAEVTAAETVPVEAVGTESEAADTVAEEAATAESPAEEGVPGEADEEGEATA
jgi:small subunit ribosomal protein S1